MLCLGGLDPGQPSPTQAGRLLDSSSTPLRCRRRDLEPQRSFTRPSHKHTSPALRPQARCTEDCPQPRPWEVPHSLSAPTVPQPLLPGKPGCGPWASSPPSALANVRRGVPALRSGAQAFQDGCLRGPGCVPGCAVQHHCGWHLRMQGRLLGLKVEVGRGHDSGSRKGQVSLPRREQILQLMY